MPVSQVVPSSAPPINSVTVEFLGPVLMTACQGSLTHVPGSGKAGARPGFGTLLHSREGAGSPPFQKSSANLRHDWHWPSVPIHRPRHFSLFPFSQLDNWKGHLVLICISPPIGGTEHLHADFFLCLLPAHVPETQFVSWAVKVIRVCVGQGLMQDLWLSQALS